MWYEIRCCEDGSTAGRNISAFGAQVSQGDLASTRNSIEPVRRIKSGTAFGEIARRMAGLGFVNPALQVEAVAFEPWQGHWLGVMVTPWFMNLVLMPRDRSLWQPLPPGAKRKLPFPAGVYEFIGADDALIGEHQTCSLFSPMHDFQDQAAARLVARLARQALFDPANAEVPAFPQADLSPGARAPAGAEAAVLDNPLLVDAHHAGFRAGEQQPVVGDGVAQRPEAVAVHAGDDPAAAPEHAEELSDGEFGVGLIRARGVIPFHAAIIDLVGSRLETHRVRPGVVPIDACRARGSP